MAPSEPTKILVVDDLPGQLVVYRSILEGPDVEVVAATSGSDALRKVLRHDFAVILLDVNMPGMDGFETATMIRGRKRSALTPIIFVTAHADEVHALRGYASGAVDFILSPVIPEILRTKVRVFVDLFRQNQRVRESAARQVADVQRERAHLTDLLDRAIDFVATIDAGLEVSAVNRAGRAMLGYTPDEPVPRRLGQYHPSWAEDLVRTRGLPLARQEGAWFGESALRAKDGREIPVWQVILAQSDLAGGVERYSMVARDISKRRKAEEELARHRTHLEDLVRDRTAKLEASHERLRLADRLASVGTLAAGLGHDMGNLLLPIRMRLETLQRMNLPGAAQEDLRAIADACEYLKRLTQGLRLFSLSPEAGGDGRTSLATWWADVSSFYRNALPRGVALEAEIPANLPPIGMSPHTLTQAVYNLVQNAGDALRNRPSGRVTVSAHAPDPDRIEVSVGDDGPGMSADVVKRCMEPFFTTKTRGISTGLGLALVHGAVRRAGGTVHISSSPGRGTLFRLVVPVGIPPAARSAGGPAGEVGAASVTLADPRLRAFISSVLRSMGFAVSFEPWSSAAAAGLLVMDDPGQRRAELESYLAVDPRRRAVILGAPGASFESDNVVVMGEGATPSGVAEVLKSMVGVSRSEVQEVRA